MRIARYLTCCAVALTAVTAIPTTVGAQATTPPPEFIARQCIEITSQATQATITGMGNGTKITIQILHRLARHHATRSELVAAARRGHEIIAKLARHAAASITRFDEHCVAILRDLGAPAALIDAVANASKRAVTAIEQAHARSRAAIGQALDSILSRFLDAAPGDSGVGAAA